ncbi:caspase family protein [Flavobacteriaceae bacterium]|nr:caspase family protein [Flavobacteriaceae bacterium]
MKKILFIFYLLVSFSISSQEEKRLALVIGNANYDKGELKNPVNDARLIASTLDSLDFDVILKENIESQIDFKRAILEFGKKRPNYDVAFVYYAGHGVQVSDENYLLPTKVEFSSEDEVEMFGVSVQDIMRYLKAQTDQVNILILDACRDNPFESNWNKTRSLKGGGLAKIPPPTGSLIAFSTDSGQTAPDGDGKNSIYTTSLSKNMLLEDTSIDQVFRNVRSEVLVATNQLQRPVEATQLTGKAFYLNVPNKLDLATRLEAESKHEEAIAVYQNLIEENAKDSLNVSFYLSYVSLNYLVLSQFDTSISYANKAIEMKQYIHFPYYISSVSLYYQDRFDEAKRMIDQAETIAKVRDLKGDLLFNIYKHKGDVLQALGLYDDSIKSYQKAYDINPKGDDISYKLALSFINNKELKKALDLLDEREDFLIQLGSLESELPQNKYYIKFQIKTIRTKVVEVLSNINLGSSYNLKKANVALSDVYAARSKIYGDSTFENFNYLISSDYMNKALELDKTFDKYLLKADNFLMVFAGFTDKLIADLVVDAYDDAANFLEENYSNELSDAELNQNLLKIYAGYAQLFLISKNYKSALKAINTSLSLVPSADAYYKKAFVLAQQESFYESYAQITLAIESFMKDPTQKIKKAVVLNEIGFAELIEFKSLFYKLFDLSLCESFFERELAFVSKQKLIDDEEKIRKIIDDYCE